MMLPRPEITDALGIKYRRIPILAIGNDVYCDTSLIADVLERRFPASQGYGTLFPPRVGSNKADTGLAKAVAVYWNDKVVFPLGGNSLPYGKLGAEFLKDRSQVRCHMILGGDRLLTVLSPGWGLLVGWRTY